MFQIGDRVRIKVGGYRGYEGTVHSSWTGRGYTIAMDNGQLLFYFQEGELEKLPPKEPSPPR